MPTTIPVPSKGALRTLRNLALGTSGTIAGGAVLLTEERRRRIHAARQVYDNAQTLKSFKSSRGYHGSVAIESFEDQIAQHGEDTFWLPSNVARFNPGKRSIALEAEDPRKSADQGHNRFLDVDKEVAVSTPSNVSPRSTPTKEQQPQLRQEQNSNVPIIRYTTAAVPKANHQPPALSKKSVPIVNTSRYGPRKALRVLRVLNQSDFALLLQETLDSGDKVSGLNSALRLLGDYFNTANPRPAEQENDILRRELLQIISRTFELAGECERYEDQDYILSILIRYTQGAPIAGWNEAFSADACTWSMLRMVSKLPATSEKYTKAGEALLLDIIRLYLVPTDITDKETLHADRTLIGEILCREAFGLAWYTHIRSIFAKLEEFRGEHLSRAAEYLIRTDEAEGKYGLCCRHYELLSQHMAWNQTSFFDVGKCVLKSLLKEDQLEGAEIFLKAAGEIAARQDLLFPSTWLLQTLRAVHTRDQEIVRTCEAFERLVPLDRGASHPQALYSAIIQFCIEADQETIALAYYDRLIALHPQYTEDLHISGHFLLAKAKQGDWDAAYFGLKKMHSNCPQRSKHQQQKFNAIFTPILKLFVQDNDIPASERFVKAVVENCKLDITPHMFNLMISVYARAKETDSLLRWLEFSASHKCNIGAVTANTLLQRFARDYNFTFSEIRKLHKQLFSMSENSQATVGDGSTYLVLEKLAVQMSRTKQEGQANLATIGCFQPRQVELLEHMSKIEDCERSMMIMHEDGQHIDCLKLYTGILREKRKPTPNMLRLAVKAQLQLGGDHHHAARDLIQRAHKGGVDVAYAIGVLMTDWIQRLENRHHDVVASAEAMQAEIRTLTESGIKASLGALTQTVHILVRRGKYRAAIDFWRTTSKYFDQSPELVDIVMLTTLMQSYLGLRDVSGIRWVLNALKNNNLFPDAKFYHVLTLARRHVSKHKDTYSLEYRDCIADACEEVRIRRQEMLQQKSGTLSETVKVITKAVSQGAEQRIPLKRGQVQFRAPEKLPVEPHPKDLLLVEERPVQRREAAAG